VEEWNSKEEKRKTVTVVSMLPGQWSQMINHSPLSKSQYVLKIYIQDNRICVQDSKICIQDSKICIRDSKICIQDSKNCIRDSKICVRDSKICIRDSKINRLDLI
jgi:hypothetical protein